MNTSNLKPFNLAEFKSNEETPVVHKDGNRATILIPPNPERYNRPVAAYFSNGRVDFYCPDGTHHKPGQYLFFSPRKKVVPLSLEDIKPGMAFRGIGSGVISFPGYAGPVGVNIPGAGRLITFQELQGCYEYSFDCLTWHRCEKEVEA